MKVHELKEILNRFDINEDAEVVIRIPCEDNFEEHEIYAPLSNIDRERIWFDPFDSSLGYKDTYLYLDA